jgi:hypothetical protein
MSSNFTVTDETRVSSMETSITTLQNKISSILSQSQSVGFNSYMKETNINFVHTGLVIAKIAGTMKLSVSKGSATESIGYVQGLRFVVPDMLSSSNFAVEVPVTDATGYRRHIVCLNATGSIELVSSAYNADYDYTTVITRNLLKLYLIHVPANTTTNLDSVSATVTDVRQYYARGNKLPTSYPPGKLFSLTAVDDTWGVGEYVKSESSWIGLASVSGYFPVTVPNGGTGLTTIPSGSILYGNGTGAISTSSSLTYDGTTFSVLGSPTANTFRVGATGGGDGFLVTALTAGNGSLIGAVNSTMLDFTQLQVTGDNVLINLRTGVGTNSNYAKFSNNVSTWTANAAGLEIYGPTNYAVLKLAGASGSDAFLASGTGGLYLNAITAVPIIFQTNNAERMRLTGEGLTIGASHQFWHPFKVVELYNGNISCLSTEINLGLNYYYDGSSYRYLTTNPASRYTQAGGHHLFYTVASGTAGNTASFTEQMRINSSGNVGIGVTPAAWTSFKALQISYGSIAATTTQFNIGFNHYYDGSDYRYLSTNNASLYTQASGDHYFYTAASGTAGDSISFTARMRIDSSGNLLLGTSTNDLGGSSNAIFGASKSGGSTDLLVYNPSNTAGSHARIWISDGGTSAGTAGLLFTSGLGGTRLSMGLDSTDSDKFKIGNGYTPGSGSTFLTIDTSGKLNVGTVSTIYGWVQSTISAGSATPTLGTGSGHLTLSNGTYGLAAGVNTSGDTWMQAHRFDGTATAYNLLLQPVGGRVSIGMLGAPSGKLEIRDSSGAPQIVLSHDGSNYMTQNINGTGILTTVLTGSASGYSWSFDRAGSFVSIAYNNSNANATGCVSSWLTEGTARGYIGALKHGTASNTLFVDEAVDGFGIRGENIIQFGIGSALKMNLTSDGNLGLGTTTAAPASTYMSGTTGICIRSPNPALSFSSTTTGKTFILYEASSAFRLYDPSAPADRFVIDTNGNMALGAFSPAARFHVIGTTEQLRLGYDLSHYNAISIASDGSATISSSGPSPYWYFYGDSGVTNVPTKFILNNNNANAYGSLFEFRTQNSPRGYIGALKHGSSLDVLFVGEQADALGIRGETAVQIGVGAIVKLGFTTTEITSTVPLVVLSQNIWRGLANETLSLAIGYQSLNATTTGLSNTAVGHQSGLQLTTANNCTFMGAVSGVYVTSASQSSAYGAGAMQGVSGQPLTGLNNSAFGFLALYRIKTTAEANCAFGSECMGSTVHITGSYNSAFGRYSLYDISSGNGNSSFGYFSLSNCTTSSFNSAFGYSSLSNIVTETNCSGLGFNTQVTGSNQVQLGDSATTTYAYGAVQDRSDMRDKADIRDTVLGIDFIMSLRPVDFRWDYREDYTDGVKGVDVEKDGSKKRNRFHHGLIAQEVKESLDNLGLDFGGFQDHSISGGADVMSIGYTELVPILIKAVQELKAEIDGLRAVN